MKTQTRNIAAALFMLILCTSLDAQMKAGFKAGLSYSELKGPSELGSNGDELESYTLSSGFQIGLVLKYEFTDLVGLKTEFLFSQRTLDYNYTGEGYFIFDKSSNLTATGQKETRLSINNAFLDIPFTAYYRIGKFEVNGGFNLGLLAASKAEGVRTFRNGISDDQTGTLIPNFTQNPIYNYFRDVPSDFILGEARRIEIGAEEILLPGSPGAYFDYDNVPEPLYKKFEFGLIGGVNYFLNNGLALGTRFHYGLSDMTSNITDVSLQMLDPDSNELVSSSDKDSYLSYQVFIAFYFK